MAESSAGAREKARAFVDEYSGMLGLDGEVTLVGERVDKLGQRHLTFEQSYRGVPVFAGMVRAHFEGDGRLVAVNGNLVPGIRVNPNPTRSADRGRRGGDRRSWPTRQAATCTRARACSWSTAPASPAASTARAT